MKNLRPPADCAWCKKAIADGEPRETWISNDTTLHYNIAETVCLFCHQRLTRMAREAREARIARTGR